MNVVAKVISTVVKEGFRKIKLLGFGKNDVKELYELSPYGTDANPIKGMEAVYMETADKGKLVVVGYINTNRLAAVGEHRTFSTNAQGTQKFYIWQKADGTCEIGGNTKHLTRFEELETGFNQLKQDFNSFLTHVHGGAGTPPAPPALPSTASISGAKINEIKTL